MTPTTETPLRRTTLSDASLWHGGTPHEVFERMQHDAPLHFSSPSAEGGFWSVTRYEDVQAIARDLEHFAVAVDECKRAGLQHSPMSPQEHSVQQDARRVIGAITDRKRFDLVTDLAAALPGRKAEPLADATRNTFCETVVALLEHPKQLALLLDHPDAIDRAIEEGLRCFPPMPFVTRLAVAEVKLHGETIRAGDRVLLWYVASNRDASVFNRPQEFDITRDEADRHHAFGGRGPSMCPGAGVARLNLKSWVRAVLSELPDLALDGPARRSGRALHDRLESVPVRRRGL